MMCKSPSRAPCCSSVRTHSACYDGVMMSFNKRDCGSIISLTSSHKAAQRPASYSDLFGEMNRTFSALFSKLDVIRQLSLHPHKQFHLINTLMFSVCPPSSQKAINSTWVRNTQIITEQLQVCVGCKTSRKDWQSCGNSIDYTHLPSFCLFTRFEAQTKIYRTNYSLPNWE